MVIAALTMLVFATMDMGFGLRFNLEAFIYVQVDPEVHFADTAYWINVMKMGTYVAQTFVGDIILVRRFLFGFFCPIATHCLYADIALSLLDRV